MDNDNVVNGPTQESMSIVFPRRSIPVRCAVSKSERCNPAAFVTAEDAVLLLGSTACHQLEGSDLIVELLLPKKLVPAGQIFAGPIPHSSRGGRGGAWSGHRGRL